MISAGPGSADDRHSAAGLMKDVPEVKKTIAETFSIPEKTLAKIPVPVTGMGIFLKVFLLTGSRGSDRVTRDDCRRQQVPDRV